LDINLLQDLFELCGIALTDEEAIQCLQDTEHTTTNKSSLSDLLAWWRKKTAFSVKDPLQWRQAARMLAAIKDAVGNWLTDTQAMIIRQYNTVRALRTYKTELDTRCTKPVKSSESITKVRVELSKLHI
jgi:hypothetical protein